MRVCTHVNAGSLQLYLAAIALRQPVMIYTTSDIVAFIPEQKSSAKKLTTSDAEGWQSIHQHQHMLSGTLKQHLTG